MKTGQQIENDIFTMLSASNLPKIIGGKVYKHGMRPKNSEKEDAIVRFVTGLPGQIQTGTVVVNIYVPDIVPYIDGIKRKDTSRCEVVEQASAEWVKSLTTAKSEYLFELSQTIYTEEEPEIYQHFVTIRLKFKNTTF